MTDDPPRKRISWTLFFAILACALSLGNGAITLSRTGDLKRAETDSCKDKKIDRFDNARAWTQAALTWESRAKHSSSSYERSVAASTATVYNSVATSLRSRLYHCGIYINDHQRVLDLEAVKRANQTEKPKKTKDGQP